MSSRLESLPTEVLQLIFEGVKASEDYKHSSLSWSAGLDLTSKRCRSLVIQHQFRRLSFYVCDFEELAEELTDCTYTLRCSMSIYTVQRVYIEAHGSRYPALECERVVQLLQMFPNLRNLRIYVKNPKSFPDTFDQGVKEIFDVCCHERMEDFSGRYYNWWQGKAN
jgi:hypothetical protein